MSEVVLRCRKCRAELPERENSEFIICSSCRTKNFIPAEITDQSNIDWRFTDFGIFKKDYEKLIERKGRFCLKNYRDVKELQSFVDESLDKRFLNSDEGRERTATAFLNHCKQLERARKGIFALKIVLAAVLPWLIPLATYLYIFVF